MTFPKMMFSKLASFNRSTGGAAAVEFALVVPVFLMIVFGTFQYSRLFYERESFQYVVEQAARCAAVKKSPECASPGATQNYARDLIKNVTGRTVPAAVFTVTYQCDPTPGA